MYTVTERISNLHDEKKLPYGGYLSLRDFKEIQLHDSVSLHKNENIHAGLIGITVDYLTRFIMGDSVEEAFRTTICGSISVFEFGKAKVLLKQIRCLDSKSVTAACKLAGYEVCFRRGTDGFRSISEIDPDEHTIENIVTMVNRSKAFFNTYGPVLKKGTVFHGGYSPIVSRGDGDYLSKDTIWDLKVIRKPPKPDYRLQILMYYILGVVSGQKEFESVEFLGLYNPRLNRAYRCPIKLIPMETIKTVCHDVLGYDWSEEEYKAFYKQHGMEYSASLLPSSDKALCQNWEIVTSQIARLPEVDKNMFYKEEDLFTVNRPFKVGDLVKLKGGGRAVITSIINKDDCEIALLQDFYAQKHESFTSDLEHLKKTHQ